MVWSLQRWSAGHCGGMKHTKGLHCASPTPERPLAGGEPRVIDATLNMSSDQRELEFCQINIPERKPNLLALTWIRSYIRG